MNTRFLLALFALSLLALGGSACHRQSYAADDKSKIHVGIVFDIGGKDDRSFNAAAWAGVRCAETGKWPSGENCGKPGLGIVLRDIEPGNPTSIEPAMRAFADDIAKLRLVIERGDAVGSHHLVTVARHGVGELDETGRLVRDLGQHLVGFEFLAMLFVVLADAEEF